MSLDFFDMEWMFGIKEGFDVIIGNPPWVSLNGKHGIEDNLKNRTKLLEIYSENTYMPNLYEFFIQRSIKILDENGLLTFIIPDRFGFNESLKYLRKKFIINYSIKEIVYKWNFEQIIADTMTFVLENKLMKKEFIKIKSRPSNEFIKIDRQKILDDENMAFKSYDNYKIFSLIEKIIKSSIQLKEISFSTSGFGGKSELIYDSNIDEKQITILKGSSIARFNIVKFYYFEFKEENITGRTRDKIKLGKKEKILLRKTGKDIIATYDNESIFPEQSLYFIYDLKSSYSYKYILSLLNSNFMNWFYNNELVTNLDSTPQLKNSDLNKIPIKDIPLEQQQPFIYLVDQIMEKKKIGKDTQYLEDKIDLMVYKLYELTYDEVKIVDPEFKLSESEYINFV